MYESIIVFRAKRDPLRDAAHSCKSSIGRMKRVIRYVHSIYNDASIFRESRFLSLLWFRENNTPPPLSPASHARLLIFFSYSHEVEIVFAREDPRGTPIVSRERGTYATASLLIIERFRGSEIPKSHARRVPKIRFADRFLVPIARRMTVYIAHNNRSVKFVSDSGGGNPRVSRSPRASSGPAYPFAGGRYAQLGSATSVSRAKTREDRSVFGEEN